MPAHLPYSHLQSDLILRHPHAPTSPTATLASASGSPLGEDEIVARIRSEGDLHRHPDIYILRGTVDEIANDAHPFTQLDHQYGIRDRRTRRGRMPIYAKRINGPLTLGDKRVPLQ
jgi:hypothetical protein